MFLSSKSPSIMNGKVHFYSTLAFILFPVFSVFLYAQTFTFTNTASGTLASSSTVNKDIIVTGVPTSGMVLQQVNFHFGNSTNIYSGDLASFTLRLRDPLSNEIILLSGANSFTTTSDADRRVVQMKMRDHAALNTPKQQQSYSPSNTISNGYPFFQGYYRPEQSFSSLNTTTNVNGTWQFRITTSSSTFLRTFNSVELIFGPPLEVIDIRGVDPNMSCATKQCIETGQRYWARNNGYPHGQVSSPPFTVEGCNWNGENNNMAWFYFVASSTTAQISLSGFQTTQESSVFKTTDCSTYTRVTGGCAPVDLFAGSTHSTRYFKTNYAGGFRYNHEYFLSGLSVGELYVLVIDGQSGTQSNFYVELLAGGDIGCSALPVDFVDLTAECSEHGVNLSWATETESNNDFFTLEKSTDGDNWEFLGRISGKGTTTEYSNYNFTDTRMTTDGVQYYRLKQTDFDGRFEYLKTVSLNCKTDFKGGIFAYPNPTNGEFNVFGVEKGDNIQVFDAVGTLLWSGEAESKVVHIDVNSNRDGVYFIHVISNNQVEILKVIKRN